MGCKRALTGYVCITALLCFALSVDLHVSPSTDHLANKVINKRGEQFINPDDDRSAGTTTPRERRIFSEVSTSAEPGGGYLFHQGVQQCCTNNSTTIGDPPVVYLSIYVRSISSIDAESMDYVVDLYLQQQWFDGRLANASRVQPVTYNDRKNIQKVWKPDVIFTNSKDSSFHYITLPNVLMRIDALGNVLYILRLKIKFDCMMDFFKFPMDEQTCTMELSTFAKTTDELQLRWHTEVEPITLYERLKLPQFQIASVDALYCNVSFYFGQYSCLKAHFNLIRELSYHLVQSYFSTSLIVVISWLSFWLDIDAIAARITLGVTTLLTISSKGVGIENKLPPVTYLKAIDVWIFMCTSFVFAALLEFSVANYIWRIERGRRGTLGYHHQQHQQQKQQFRHQQFVTTRNNSNNNKVAWLLLNQKQDPRATVKPPLPQMMTNQSGTVFYIAGTAERIDQRSRLLFPVFFFLFSFLYWFYYSYWI